MNTAIPAQEMTAAQIEQMSVVQADVLELMKRLVRDGFDYRVVMTGTTSAVMDLILRTLGPREVPMHFARMTAMTYHLRTDWPSNQD